jgi:hypothetical protein
MPQPFLNSEVESQVQWNAAELSEPLAHKLFSVSQLASAQRTLA